MKIKVIIVWVINVNKDKVMFIIAIILMISMFTFLFIGLMTTIYIQSITPVRYETIRMGASSKWFFETRVEGLERSNKFIGNNLLFFDNIETAIQYYNREEIRSSSSVLNISEEIIRFETDRHILIALPSTIPSWPWIRIHNLHFLLMEKYDSQFSYPIHAWIQNTERSNSVEYGIWYDEDRIARDLIESYVYSVATTKVNGEIPIYYGAGMGLPPSHISILGYEPDNIFHFEYRNTDYFFWYYLSDNGFSDLIRENIDMSSKTLGSIIELFDIKVIR